MDLSVLIVVWLGCAILTGMVGSSKGNGFAGNFILGAVLGIIGLAIALIAKPKEETSGRLGQLTPAGSDGWHRDPTGRFDRRYYDGQRWTMHVTRDADKQRFEDPI